MNYVLDNNNIGATTNIEDTVIDIVGPKTAIESCKNILIAGNNGSGKTILVQDILYLLAKQLTPQEFNFYILDYSSRMMKQFRALPHCGDVLYEEDFNSLDGFFKLINVVIAERKHLFSKLGVDSFEAARSIQKLPLILVVIDNIAGLNLSKPGENHYYKLPSYLKGSANYGVKYIITCSNYFITNFSLKSIIFSIFINILSYINKKWRKIGKLEIF